MLWRVLIGISIILLALSFFFSMKPNVKAECYTLENKTIVKIYRIDSIKINNRDFDITTSTNIILNKSYNKIKIVYNGGTLNIFCKNLS